MCVSRQSERWREEREHERRGEKDRVGSTNCKLNFYYDRWDGLLKFRQGSLTVDAITGHGCFKSGSPIDLTSHWASADPHCCVIMPGINRALHHIAAAIMDSVEFNSSPLLFPNSSFSTSINSLHFSFLPLSPLLPFGFHAIIVSVLFCTPLYLIPCCPWAEGRGVIWISEGMHH